MTSPDDTDLPETDLADTAVGDRLQGARPTPRSAFRGELGRRLAHYEGRPLQAPARLNSRIAGYAVAGAALLALAALGAAGLGPIG